MTIPPASNVLAVVFAALTFGLALGAALIRIPDRVAAGHFKVVYVSCFMTAAIAVLLGSAVSVGVALVAGGAFFLARAGRDKAAAFILVAVAATPLFELGRGAEILDFLAVSLLAGGTTSAMLLGHWHLNQPGLKTGPLKRLVGYAWAGLALGVADAVWLYTRANDSGTVFVGAVTAGAFTVFSMVLAAMVTHLVNTRSIMSATGILYLQVLLAFVSGFTLALASLAA